MKGLDRAAYIRRYERRLEDFGHSPESLGWGQLGREAVRFAAMADPIREVRARSVLDVGCGFADFYDFLLQSGWHGEYRGIDIVPGLLDVARHRHPTLEVEEADIADYRLGDSNCFDVVVASGVFNWELEGEDNLTHIERSVTRMFELARSAVYADFMSTFVDFQQPSTWHTNPAWAMAMARRFSKRFRLRHDYMPFEFGLVVYCDDDHPGNVFKPSAGIPP